MGKAWGGIQVMAKDPQIWKDYIAALHHARNNGARVSEWASDVSSGPYIKLYSVAAHLSDNLVLSSTCRSIMWIGHHKEIWKLMFRALVLHCSKLIKGQCTKLNQHRADTISLRWPIHIINPVDKTKLPVSCNTPHRHSITISSEGSPLYPFINLQYHLGLYNVVEHNTKVTYSPRKWRSHLMLFSFLYSTTFCSFSGRWSSLLSSLGISLWRLCSLRTLFDRWWFLSSFEFCRGNPLHDQIVTFCSQFSATCWCLFTFLITTSCQLWKFWFLRQYLITHQFNTDLNLLHIFLQPFIIISICPGWKINGNNMLNIVHMWLYMSLNQVSFFGTVHWNNNVYVLWIISYFFAQIVRYSFKGCNKKTH